MELFEHEFERPCPKCGKLVHGEASKLCISWCAYAEKCVKDLKKRFNKQR